MNIYENANASFEHYDQLIKLCEECGELITATSKILLSGNLEDVNSKDFFNLIDELADVNIVLKQMNIHKLFKNRIKYRIKIKENTLKKAIEDYDK